jgi:hypothetical protein
VFVVSVHSLSTSCHTEPCLKVSCCIAYCLSQQVPTCLRVPHTTSACWLTCLIVKKWHCHLTFILELLSSSRVERIQSFFLFQESVQGVTDSRRMVHVRQMLTVLQRRGLLCLDHSFLDHGLGYGRGHSYCEDIEYCAKTNVPTADG